MSGDLEECVFHKSKEELKQAISEDNVCTLAEKDLLVITFSKVVSQNWLRGGIFYCSLSNIR